MATVADVRRQLEGLADDVEVLVELPGTMRPVTGVAVRTTPEDGVRLVFLADL